MHPAKILRVENEPGGAYLVTLRVTSLPPRQLCEGDVALCAAPPQARRYVAAHPGSCGARILSELRNGGSMTSRVLLFRVGERWRPAAVHSTLSHLIKQGEVVKRAAPGGGFVYSVAA